MTARTPLEQALAAWLKPRNPDDPGDRQVHIDDAVTLGETGVFSNSNIALITGLDAAFVGELTKKTDKTGGRFNPEALSVLYDIRLQWARAKTCDPQAIRTAISIGCSAAMLAKLTGVPRMRAYYPEGRS